MEKGGGGESTRVTVSLKSWVFDALAARACRTGLSKSAIVTMALTEYLDRTGRKAGPGEPAAGGEGRREG